MPKNLDLICFTGDLQNVTPDELLSIEALLNSLKARDGVMSVLGNHDYTYYMDVDDEQEIAALEKRMQDFQRSCGWRLLMNEHVAVHRGADSIYVAGTENYDKPKRTNVRKALYRIRPGSFVLMLQHMPKQWRETWPSTINKEKDEDGDVIGRQEGFAGRSTAAYAERSYACGAYQYPGLASVDVYSL